MQIETQKKWRWGMIVLVGLFIGGFSLTTYAAPVTSQASEFAGKKIAFVQVAGNTNISADTVLAATKVKPGDAWMPDRVKQDLQLIYELGLFSDVTADYTAIPEGIKIVYRVKENPILKNVIVTGNQKVTTDRILSLLALKPGTVLNTKTLSDSTKVIEDHYKALGYILAKVSDASFGQDGVLAVKINEGLLEDIVVKGNTKTKTYVVTREVRIKKGQAFNSKDARKSMQKLYDLGYFEDVNVKLLPGKLPGSVVMEITVVEQKTGTFSIGGGYNAADGLTAIIGLGDKNFQGKGDDAKVSWTFGGNASSTGFMLSYSHPWWDEKQTSLSFSVFSQPMQYSDYSNDGSYISTYNRKYEGFEITVGRPLNDNLWYYIGLKNRRDMWIEQVAGANYNTDALYQPDYINNNFGLTRSIILSRVFDTRDSISNPSTGIRSTISAEIAGFGGDFSFTKYTTEFRKYWPSGKQNVWAFRAAAGFGAGNIPLVQQFSVGGIDTLRGYRDDQFKGKSMFISSLEYRYPIVKRVQGVLFVDAGNTWHNTQLPAVSDFNGLNVGYGLGIRIISPFGPLRIDYGFGSQTSRVHFGFSGQF